MNAVESTATDRPPEVSPWLASLMLRRGGGTLSRFAAFYRGLVSQPRPWRRRLQRRLAVTLTGTALLLALAGPTAYLGAASQDSPASIITVVDGEVEIAADGRCSLIEAIVNAQATDAGQLHADCAAGNLSGPDTIQLPPGGVFTLTQAYDDQYNGLPPITGAVTIEGNGARVQREQTEDTPPFRIMLVTASGELALKDTVLTGGYLDWTGMGEDLNGAGILNAGRVSIVGGGILNNRNYDAGTAGGIHNTGEMTVDGSAVAENDGSPGGIGNTGDMTITDSQIIDNSSFGAAGGIGNAGTMVVYHSELGRNTSYIGTGGLDNIGVMRIEDSNVVGNRACYHTSIGNDGELTISNSTISSGDIYAICGGRRSGLGKADVSGDYEGWEYNAVSNGGILTLNNTTVTNHNHWGQAAIWNTGKLVLNRALVSGNGEYNISGTGEFVANNYNVFGSDGNARVDGFEPGERDVVPDQSLDGVIRPLGFNGGDLLTHALPTGSPAIDLASSIDCSGEPIGGIDQRGLPRNQDGDGVAGPNECDSGATEMQPIELENALLLTTMAAGTTTDGLSYRRTDILKWNGLVWSVFFDGRAAGLPTTADIAAIAVPAAVEPDVYLVFVPTRVRLPGAGIIKAHDIVRWDSADFSLFFDGSDVGLTELGERIDGLEVSPYAYNCSSFLLISTTGPGEVRDAAGEAVAFSGEDILGFCLAQSGEETLGEWRPDLILDGSQEGMPIHATFSLAQSAIWNEPLYLTSRGPFAVDEASGTHSMVYGATPRSWPDYDYWFTGPYFSAADHGLLKKVDGLEVLGDLP